MKASVCLLLSLCLTPSFIPAQTTLTQPSNRITAAVSVASMVALPNSIYPALAAAPSTPVDQSFALEHMILALQPSASQQAALQLLLAEQTNPASPNFHKFLTPAQFASEFGLSPSDLGKVTAWLTSNGFHIDSVAASNLAITFSGTAGQLESAFRTQIREYEIGGVTHYANATAPQIPAALAPVVQGLVKLHDFQSTSSAVGFKLLPQYTVSNSVHYLVPSDYNVIYNLDPLFRAGINGSSQSIAVLGRSNVKSTDLATFRADYALPAASVTPIFATGTDPGVTGTSDTLEATLDVEWAGAVAPLASIKLVLAASTATTDGIALAATYAVNNNVAPVISVSYGECESLVNNSFYNSLWQQAAAEGITVIVSAGDSGAANCDVSSATTGTVRAVNGIASTPYNTSVGGTMFNDTGDPAEYWLPGNNAVMGSAISYIPEVVWNESGLMSGGSDLLAGGGGVSTIYSKPAWQSGPGVPADGMRDVPDVSLTAAQHDGYVITYNGQNAFVAGTSAAAPAFAGMMALVTQKYGLQGNVNPILYPLAAAGLPGVSTPPFHDITSGNNSVPGVTGYAAGTGYDLASGLGSINAAQLVDNWTDRTGGFNFAGSASSVNGSPGQNGAVTLTVTPIGSFNSAVDLSILNLPNGVTASFSPAVVNGSGTSVLTFIVSGNAVSGTYPLTLNAISGAFSHLLTLNLVLSVPPQCTLTATPASISVLLSQSTSAKLACSSEQGLSTSTLTLSVTGAPAGLTASFSPASLAPSPSTFSTLVINAASTVVPGTYTLAVTATLPNSNPAFTSTLNVPVTVNAPTTFNVTPSATSLTFAQGASTTLTLTSVHSGSFNSSIGFSVSGLPSTIAATVAPATLAAPGDGTVTITLQSTSSVAAGTYTMTVLAQGGGLSLRIPIPVQVTVAPAFVLSDSAAVLTLRQSGTAAVNFTTGNLTNGFSQPVTFTISALPTGVTSAFSVPTIVAPGAGTSVLTLTAAATATTGVTTFTVTATGGTVTRTLNVQLTVTPPSTFSLSASVPSCNMIAGASLTETITSTALYGFTDSVQLSTGALPGGLSAIFASPTIPGVSGKTIMTIQTLATLTPGPYTITVTGTDPITNITQTVSISLIVGTVNATLSATSLSIVPGSGPVTDTITVTATSFIGNITLGVGGLPVGVTYSLTPAALPGSGTSTLTITAAADAPQGYYTVTLVVSAGGLITNIPITVYIT